MAKPKQHNSSTVYHLSSQHEGWSLAAALKDQVESASWGQVKKWISKRHVQVNGNLCRDEARRVRSKDVLKLWREPLPKPVDAGDIRIRHLDDQLLVVCKPAGITSVRHFAERKLSTRRRQLQPTLEELLPPVLAKMLRLRWPPLPPVGMNRGRRQHDRRRGKQPAHIQNAKKLPPELQIFPVHRLDRDTSGLMLFARTRDCEQRLVAMFRRHAVERQYVAICQGEVAPQTFRSFLARDRGDGLRGSVPEGTVLPGQPDPLLAVTHVRASESFCTSSGACYSELRCELETGRTHQIRIHLAEAGHPLCGDRLYHRLANGQLLTDTAGAPRQALHSDRLRFTHPYSGESLQFHMPLPKELSAWLTKLKEL